MPGRLFLTTPLGRIAASVGAPPVPEEGPRLDIRPGEELAVLVAGPVLWRMRWGLIPAGRVNARGRPVLETIVNARSETVFSKSAFEGVGRCAVPFDGWYEWTGPPRRKTRWRLSAADGGVLFAAGISDAWTAPGGREVWQMATVTCPPSPEVARVHDRMAVLLSPAQLPLWLEGSIEEAAVLMKTAEPGAIRVEPAPEA